MTKLENQLCSQVYLDILSPGDIFLEQNGEEKVILLHAESRSSFRFLLWRFHTSVAETDDKKADLFLFQSWQSPILQDSNNGVSRRLLALRY